MDILEHTLNDLRNDIMCAPEDVYCEYCEMEKLSRSRLYWISVHSLQTTMTSLVPNLISIFLHSNWSLGLAH